MMTCPFCGTENRANAAYCNSCGGALGSSPGKGRVGARATSGASGVQGPQTAPHHATGRLPPHTLIAGRYHVVRVVGHGGMAAVYQAADLKSNRIIALKEMGQDGLTPDEVREAIDAFRFEADTLTRLRHPNLPRVYERFSENARHYLAMEFINGQTLQERLDAASGKPLPEAEVLGWARQLCAVLSYLHSQRPPIIFRDLKPGNAMLTSSGEIKLIDFGIARVFAPGRTRDTQILGTPGFAPPEQYGKAQTDARADIYALGCTLYQLLSAYDPGTTPFALPPLRSRNPAITPAVQLAIERATQLDRDKRFASMDDFARALLMPPGLVFFSGAVAHNTTELLALCRQQPQEAADHLAYGRIETWLRGWGNTTLAQAATTARARTPDRAAALTAFLDAAAHAQQPQVGSWVTSTLDFARKLAATAQTARAAAAQVNAARTGQTSGRAGTTTAARPQAAASTAAPSTTVEVRPASVLFGQLPKGQRGTYTITISGKHGAHVRGTLTPGAQWLKCDVPHFNGQSSVVTLIAETSLIPMPGVRQTTLTIYAAGKQVVVPVTVDVVPASSTSQQVTNAAKAAKTQGKQTGTQAKNTPNARPAVKTRHVPTAHAPLPLTLALAFVLALVAGQGVLLGAAHLWPMLQLALGLPLATPERLGILVLALLGVTLGAFLTMGTVTLGTVSALTRHEAIPRLLTTLVGGCLGAGIAFAAFAPVDALLQQGAPLLTSMVTATTPGLVLALVFGSAGAALGSEARGSWLLRSVGRFLRRWSAVITGIALIALGAFVGHFLLSGVLDGVFAGMGLIAGGMLGAMLAGRWYTLTRQRRRSRKRRSPQRTSMARARP